jgi:hypothetical protein
MQAEIPMDSKTSLTGGQKQGVAASFAHNAVITGNSEHLTGCSPSDHPLLYP